MKKSKIIIGAVALLGVSIAATTTGTLAWFTATNKSTVGVGNVVAVNASAALKVNIIGNASHGTAGVVTGNDSSAASFNIETLRDSSLDLKSGAEGALASIANVDSNGTITGMTHLTDIAGIEADKGSYATKIGASGYEKNVYYYAEFDIQFTLSAEVDQKYNVFFDPTTAVSTLTGETESKNVKSALRVGFRNSDVLTAGTNFTGTTAQSLERYFVWAPAYDTTTTVLSVQNPAIDVATGLAYTAYSDATTATKGTGIYTDSEAFVTKVKPTATTDLTYLGDLNAKVSGAISLTYHAYIWFEGEDLLCNTNEISAAAYNLSLGFFAEKAAA